MPLRTSYRHHSRKFPRQHVNTRIRIDILDIARPLLEKNNSSIHHLIETSLLTYIFQHSPDFNTYLYQASIKSLPKHIQSVARALPPATKLFFASVHTHATFPRNYAIFITAFNSAESVDAAITHPALKEPILLLNASTSMFSTSKPF